MRHLLVVVIGLLLASTAGGQEAGVAKSELAKADQAAAQPADKPALPRLATHQELRSLLATPSEKLARFSIDPGTSLRDALDTLAVVLSTPETLVEFRIAEDLFEDRQAAANPGEAPAGVWIARPVRGRTPASILREILKPVRATYLVRKDHILVIPRNSSITWTGFAPYLTLHVQFENVPWRDAIERLAEETGVTIMVHPDVAEAGKDDIKVRAYFNNTHLFTALRLLAEMKNVSVVGVRDVLLIAPKDVANQLIKSQEAYSLADY